MDAIITAAGRNSRMIEDFTNLKMEPIHKLKLKIDDKPIIIHTIENVMKADIENITVMLGHFRDEIYGILDEYSMLDCVRIRENSNVDVALSETILNALSGCSDCDYLFMAADQPTISPETINNMINIYNSDSDKYNLVSVLARRKTGVLNSAEGLGMPFCCYGSLIYNYLKGANCNLNPILRNMIKDGVKFYGIEAVDDVELLNINHYSEYLKIKDIIEKSSGN
ncbi:MAG: NTP transferase domain-containing protein [Methanosphaera sp.]|uniref:nucleotidyltransferase family protein n=1 Tax=Methanosphaera sp. TaxID=2666342 RepID=UPI0025E8726F|nr:NTP transferase domain-containing protein [Methanosphaera sp.]MCI5867389.1 NTP transferase domain-containing protein [Methanosphaera sp.]MDD6534543.1 NTP transferase domain-containing protein [Methanosphaera sp.]MDY3955788.1 NTP transferase domain-containing protein [Methanosphaera sp.]